MQATGKIRKRNITIKDITMAGIMVAVIEVCKAALSFLPNVELTTFWLVMFTLFFGGKIVLVVPVFILIEGAIYGFGLWWVMYLYLWPLLVLVAWFSRKQESVWYWSIVSGAFGLLFGFFCSIPYMVIGFVSGGMINGLTAGFTWWIAGIPFDLIHGIANFVLMRILYKPVRNVMRHLTF